MSPKNKFYEVTVLISEEDNKGRIKKNSTKYLIDAQDTREAENNTMKLMEGTMSDWEIIGINISKIKEIYLPDIEDNNENEG
jgi:hypothetical protein